SVPAIHLLGTASYRPNRQRAIRGPVQQIAARSRRGRFAGEIPRRPQRPAVSDLPKPAGSQPAPRRAGTTRPSSRLEKRRRYFARLPRRLRRKYRRALGARAIFGPGTRVLQRPVDRETPTAP